MRVEKPSQRFYFGDVKAGEPARPDEALHRGGAPMTRLLEGLDESPRLSGALLAAKPWRGGSTRPLNSEEEVALERLEFFEGRMLDPEFLSNRVFLEHALTRWPELYSQLDATLKADPRLAFLYLTHSRSSPDLYSIPPRLLANPEFALDAAIKQPSLLRDVAPSLSASRAFVERVIRHQPAAVRFLPDSLSRDRSFLRSLLERSGSLLEHLESLQWDEEMCRVALRSSFSALGSVRNQTVLADRELIAEALRNGGGMTARGDEWWTSDAALSKVAVEHSSLALNHVKETALTDEVLRAAAGRSAASVVDNHYRLDANQRAWVQAMVDANPVLLAATADPTLWANATPAAREQGERLRELRESLNLDLLGRFDTPEAMEEILENRRAPEAVDHRPLAVVILSKDDWNGAFKVPNYAALTEGYRVLYYEADDDTDIRAAVLEATTSQKASLLVVGGHGERERLALGASDPRFGEVNEDEADYLDLTDRADLEGLSARTEAGAHVVLLSCSNGEGRGAVENVANLVAAAFPAQTIWSSTTPSNLQWELDEQGLFVGPGFWGGELSTYRIDPRAPRSSSTVAVDWT